MSLVVVFTPTARHGGLDVTWSSLIKQSVSKDIHWIIADELLDERQSIYDSMEKTDALRCVESFRVWKRPGYHCTLTSSYIVAMERARQLGADLFISLQDYIWIDDDAIEKFLEVSTQAPHDLLTGFVSFADNPKAADIESREGLFTIFHEPFTGKPKTDNWKWRDVRREMSEDYPVIANRPQVWELNWCAIPKSILDSGLDFDAEFDMGIGFEHQVYAYEAMEHLDANIIVVDNEAISLPHTEYFPDGNLANNEVNYIRAHNIMGLPIEEHMLEAFRGAK